ncbi:MAG TPA: hypothetical protein VFJ58_19470 [Armatimonadota bacterium]|nr:hypothetical protein [Armatimonadota bacterium]
MARMHAGEMETDVLLVRRLIGNRFPERAGLSIAPVTSAEKDNASTAWGRRLRDGCRGSQALDSATDRGRVDARSPGMAAAT